MAWYTKIYRWLRVVIFVLLTPWLEKNHLKTAHLNVPIAFSMSRVIISFFAWGMYHQMVKAGIAGWPEATLCIALAFALPVLAALEKAKPAEVLEFGKAIIDRFGVGDVRKIGNLYKEDPETQVDREHEEVK